MKAVNHPGYCKICGEFRDLTAEHIPPKSAFNSNTITVFPFEEAMKVMCGADGRMPWDINGLQGRL